MTNVSSAEDVTGSNSITEKKPKYIDESTLTVTLSSHDKASTLSLSEDKLWCWGERNVGFCLARSTHAVDGGKYFWECEILDPSTRSNANPDMSRTGNGEPLNLSGDAHVRLGWATDAANITAPIGYDSFGYGYRDIAGSKVHNSVRTENYGEPFGIGDVIGCHISMDLHEPFKNEIRFFKNGVDQGTAFKGSGIKGVFFPAVSLYRDALVRVNFGPYYIFPYNFVSKMAAQLGDGEQGEYYAELALKYDSQYFAGTLPVSELQPLSTEQKKVHSEYVSQRRAHYYSNNESKQLSLSKS